LASTADRLTWVAGHDDAIGRGGNAASSAALVGFTSPLFGVMTSVRSVLTGRTLGPCVRSFHMPLWGSVVSTFWFMILLGVVTAGTPERMPA